jgi:hypothetical protein
LRTGKGSVFRDLRGVGFLYVRTYICGQVLSALQALPWNCLLVVIGRDLVGQFFLMLLRINSNKPLDAPGAVASHSQ